MCQQSVPNKVEVELEALGIGYAVANQVDGKELRLLGRTEELLEASHFARRTDKQHLASGGKQFSDLGHDIVLVALDVLGAAKGGKLVYACGQGMFSLTAFVVEATAADDASFFEKSVGDAKGRAGCGTAIKALVVRLEAECKVAGLKVGITGDSFSWSRR